MKMKKFLLLLACLVCFSGCSTVGKIMVPEVLPIEERVTKGQYVNPDELALHNLFKYRSKIVYGMSEQEFVSLVGKPVERSVFGNRNNVTVQLMYGGIDFRYLVFIYFENNLLSNITINEH